MSIIKEYEEEKLCKAMDDFAAEMKKRLIAKARQGYMGWDVPSQIFSRDLRLELVNDAAAMYANENDAKAVDVANRAMMLWYRSNKI